MNLIEKFVMQLINVGHRLGENLYLKKPKNRNNGASGQNLKAENGPSSIYQNGQKRMDYISPKPIIKRERIPLGLIIDTVQRGERLSNEINTCPR